MQACACSLLKTAGLEGKLGEDGVELFGDGEMQKLEANETLKAKFQVSFSVVCVH